MRYPFVLFDAGGTLFGPRGSFGATYAEVLLPMGLDLPAAGVERELREVWKEMSGIMPRGIDRYGYFEGGEDGYWLRFARGTIERAAGRQVSSSFAWDALRRLRQAFREKTAWEVFPDVMPTLALLRDQGVRMGVVSNWDSRLPGLLRTLGLAVFFDSVIVSHLEGMEKPEPELFRRALARLGGLPQQTLAVGDVPELDLAGARAAGIDGVLVDRRGRLGPEVGALPDLVPVARIVAEGLPAGPTWVPGR